MSEGNGEFRWGASRRSFLKSSGMAAVVAAAGSGREQPARAEEPNGQLPERAADAIDLVNVLQGTNSTPVFSRGNTLPIAAVPFGMAHWTLQSESRGPWMFEPGSRRLQGFRCTHQLSPWLSDYGQSIFFPFSGEPDLEPSRRSSSWRPEQADLHPYSFRLSMMRFETDVEMVPTTRCSVIAAHNRSGLSSGFLIEVPKGAEPVERGQSEHSIRFRSTIHEGGVPANFATYYVVRFSGSWQAMDIKQSSGSLLIVLRFGQANQIEARIATSFISFEQAEKNLERELGPRPLEQIRSDAKAEWLRHFHRLEIEGGSERQRKTFYSSLYRALLFPRIWHELDDAGKPYHFSAYNGKVAPGVMYADHGYWDVYRAWYPWMSVIFPERLARFCRRGSTRTARAAGCRSFPLPVTGLA